MFVVQKKKKLTRKSVKNGLFVGSIVAWPLLLFIVFEVIGNIANFVVAFQRFDIESGEFVFLGGNNMFDNFKRFFVEFGEIGGMLPMLGRSAIGWVLGLAMIIPHTLVSFTLYKKIPFTNLFVIILYFPGIISSVVWVLIYKNMVESALPAFLSLFGKRLEMSLFMNPKTVFATLTFYGLWMGFAGGMVLNLGTMNRIPPELVEAGKMDGMNTLQEFWYITMPAMFPILSISLITCPIGIFTGSPNTFTFFGTNAPDEVYTLGYYFFQMVYGKTEVNYPYSAAASIIMTAIAAPLSLLIRRLCDKYGPSAEF